MALCLACGNSIANTNVCSKCGSGALRALDETISGTHAVRDRRSIDGDWDEEARDLGHAPSAKSLREVRRQGRTRTAQRRRGEAQLRRSSSRARTRANRPTLGDSRGGSRRWNTYGPWVVIIGVALGMRWLQTGSINVFASPQQVIVYTSTGVPQSSSPWTGLVVFALFWCAVYAAIAYLVSRSAARKGRSAVAWFFLAWFFPVISWIIVATMAPSNEALALRGLRTGSTRRCASCREIIQSDAVVCRYCGASNRAR